MCAARLTPETWLNAGLDALQAQGPSALAAEPLARALNATKGSFYWHFKDVPSFQSALLSRWRSGALAAIEDLHRDTGSADQRLRRFGHALLADRLEPQLRQWAQNAPQVAATLHEIDSRRRDFLAGLLAEIDLGNPDFAQAMIAAVIGLPQLCPGDLPAQKATFDTLVDTVLALSRL
jgi:AcrR family transcriptional regulator